MHTQRRRKRLWLHESILRTGFRAALIFLGFLPLVACIVFSVVSQTRWYQLRQAVAWRERIRNNLGLDVVFERIDFPSPSRFRIHGLVCAHPETQTPILRVDRVDGLMTSSGWGLTLDRATMRRAHADLALAIIHDSFLCRPHNFVPLLKVSIPQLEIEDADRSSRGLSAANIPRKGATLHRVEIEYSPTLEQSELKVQFALSLDDRIQPAMLHVHRHHTTEYPRTDWALETRDIELPLQLATPYLPVLEMLGQDATYRGSVQWSQDARGWVNHIQGGFANVDWSKASSAIGSPLRGAGTLRIHDARMDNGRFVYAVGEVNNAESIHTQWLKHCVQHFDWPTDDLRTLTTDWAPVSSLGIAFEVTENGLQWCGRGKTIRDGDMSYQLAGEVGGKLIATKALERQRVVPLHELGLWLASGFGDASKDTAARWQANLSTLLPKPTVQARLTGPVRSAH